MLQVVPDYYKDFHCSAGECRHTCCRGWEIEVDKESLRRYRRIRGELGKRLRDSIFMEHGTARFRLTGDERCPFLNREGLCDIILEAGEEQLCQICADHPRYRNYFPDRVETGLGLCCEAAAGLILGQRKRAEWITAGEPGETDPEEAELLRNREELIEIAQKRGWPMEKRLERIAEEMELDAGICLKADPEFLMNLEIMEESWRKRLQECSPERFREPEEPLLIPMEQFLVYLLYRHLPEAYPDGDIQGAAAFCLNSAALISVLTRGKDFPEFLEIARLWSAEIEYSDENGERLTEYLLRQTDS